LTGEEMAFLGKITAGMTHEMKNILAVIRESTGLMEDILSITKERSFQHKDKFLKVLSTIQEQVQKGVDLATRLNRFAHSMDKPKSSLDINALLDQMAFLMQRFARLKRVNLKVLPGKPISIIKDPLRLQLVIFKCIESCLKESEEGMEIQMSAEKIEEGAIVRILSQREKNKEEERRSNGEDRKIEENSGIFEELKITLHKIDGTEGRGYLLTIISDEPMV
jgi:signal transduction histidine kinase